MTKSLAFIAGATAIVVATAVYQGFVTDRWSNDVTEKLNVFTARLEGEPGIPKQIGVWESADMEVDESQFRASGCHGKISRVYRNTLTGDEISVYFVSGKAYHVTIHTPDWCYVAAGYEMEKDPVDFSFDVPGMATQPEVLTAKFRKVTSTETSQLRVVWTYSEDGVWTAPGSAKYAFVGRPALYKIYFIRALKGSSPPLSEDPVIDFAQEFLPVANAALFPAESADAEVEPLETAQRGDMLREEVAAL